MMGITLKSSARGNYEKCESQITRPAKLLAVAAVTFSVCGFLGTIHAADEPAPSQRSPQAFNGGKSAWHDDFVRYDFLMDKETFEIAPFTRPDNERFGVGAPPAGKLRCIVVVPKNPAPGNPWSWQGCYWDHEPQAEVELLRRGFHIAFITPDPGKQWDAWYEYLTAKHGPSKKPAFIGMSKGGVNEYDWTTLNPDKVSCIYADNPAIRPEAFNRLGELAERGQPIVWCVVHFAVMSSFQRGALCLCGVSPLPACAGAAWRWPPLRSPGTPAPQSL
jgi:hypothetical protein